MSTTEKKIAAGSLGYQIIQEIKKLRVLREYSQAELAKKVGISKSQMEKYEQGVYNISPKKAEEMARVLSVEFEDLLPKSIDYVSSEDEKMLSIVQNFKKIRDQEFRSAFCSLVKLLSEGIQMGKTGAKSIKYKMGEKAKDWRLVRAYTQLELANKAGLSIQQINRYERGMDYMSFERVPEMAKALSVNYGVLLPKSKEETYYEDEDSKGEMKVLNLMRECKKIEDQRLKDLLCTFLSEVVKISEEKK